ncbi:unnamed protein product [Oikopleura dioica]|uniref:Uncharacterized protein n=1 Tax=Oikopleura dioica TaxID=34765 RepID=E4YH74_OIKDI|nr:unnamed protein product [Oikopleura dioica]
MIFSISLSFFVKTTLKTSLFANPVVSVARLWSFKDEQLKGFNVNSIGFNSVGPEIVAVEYGHSQRAKGASKIPGIMLGELLLLIKVKRTSKKTKKNRSNTRKTDNAVISQLSPATSFNFNPTDGNT